jgi:hypothetical protein
MAVLVLAAGCAPDPGGSCGSDADCAGGAPGLFCAEGVCQSPPRATLVEVPTTLFARPQTATIRIRVERAHGGAGAASAVLRINGSTVRGAREPDGLLRFEVPLQLAPAGVEAMVPLEISVADDLGHSIVLHCVLSVDDLAPRVFIDADSVPSQPVSRGTVVHLRAHVFDASPVTVVASGSTLSPQADGSHVLAVDTGALDPSVTSAQAGLTATDAVGHSATSSARFAIQ